MKVISGYILFLLSALGYSTVYGQTQGWPDGKIDYDRLVESIAEVESKGNPGALSPKGTHVGYLQISKGIVDACNKITGERKFSYDDRYDKDKSIEMFMIMQGHYNPADDMILAIRMWKEGTSAVNKPRQKTAYVNKVLEIYDRLPEGGSYYLNTDFSGDDEVRLFLEMYDGLIEDD